MNKTYKLFKIKGFPAVRIANQWLVKEKDLEKFLDEYRGSFISLWSQKGVEYNKYAIKAEYKRIWSRKIIVLGR